MILMLGLAGSGKSTQCQLLHATGNYQWLSIGQLLRTAIQDPSLKAVIDSGDVLDDSIVIPMVEENIHKLGDQPELILDGFPRTLVQVEWLMKLDAEKKLEISRVIHLKATEETVYQRLIKRGRTDDHDMAINERFKEYEEMIVPILNMLKSMGIRVIEVDGEQAPETVHQSLLIKLEG